MFVGVIFMKEYDRYLNLLYVREVNFGKTKIHHHSQGDIGDSDLVDLKFITIFGCWWLNFDVNEIFWMMGLDAMVKI